MRNLLILSADVQDKSKGLFGLIKSIKSNYPDYYKDWRIIVITPEHFSNEGIRKNVTGHNIEFVQIKSPRFRSIYLYKTILGDFVASAFLPNEEILYLDYDHICLGKIILPEIINGEIYTSSEYHTLSPSVVPDKYRVLNVDIHCNTSFIYAHAQNFIEISSDWKKIGADFDFSRNSDEIAFTLSAKLNNIRVKFVDPTIQANWMNPVKSPLFHYGGDNYYAIELKKILAEEDSCNTLFVQEDGNELVKLYLNQVVNYLVKNENTN